MKDVSDENKQLLVLGCGYVGTALAQAFHAEGWQVTALTRNTAQTALLQGLGIGEVVHARLEEHDWHERVPGAPRLVINCVSSGGGDLQAYRSAYIDSNRSIAHWARSGGRRVGHFIYTGSTGVYPQTDGSTVSEEDAGGEALSPFGRVLMEAEELIRAEADAFASATVLRLAGIYGPRRHYILDQLLGGVTTFPGRADFQLNLIHLHDIVSAVRSLLEWRELYAVRAFEVFNVCDGHVATKEDIVRWLAARIGAPEPQFAPHIEPARRRASASSAHGVPHRVVSNRKFAEVTGWRPTYPSFRYGYEEILSDSHPASSHIL